MLRISKVRWASAAIAIVVLATAAVRSLPSRNPASREPPGASSSPPVTVIDPLPPAHVPENMAGLGGGTFELTVTKETVTIVPFALDLTEVTVDAYARCVRAGACTEPIAEDSLGDFRKCNWRVDGKGNHPINCVDFDQAAAYCQWVGKRLPTAAEWEWAARGGARGTFYPWGNEDTVARVCWSEVESEGEEARRHGTCPVGAFPTGDAPGGIHDLLGNVAEWTTSIRWGSDRITRGGIGNVAEWTTSIRRGSDRITRGGSWADEGPQWCISIDEWAFWSTRISNLGFRCAL